MNNFVSRKPQRWSHRVGSSAEVARFSDLSAICAVLASWASGSGHQHEGGLVKRSPTTGRGLSVMAFGYAARPNRREDTRRQPCVARPLTAGPKAPLCPIGGGRAPHPPTSRTGRRDVPHVGAAVVATEVVHGRSGATSCRPLATAHGRVPASAPARVLPIRPSQWDAVTLTHVDGGFRRRSSGRGRPISSPLKVLSRGLNCCTLCCTASKVQQQSKGKTALTRGGANGTRTRNPLLAK